MVTTGQTGLEVAEDSIEPAKLGHRFGFAAGHDPRVMAASGVGDGTTASQVAVVKRYHREAMSSP